ncbi:Uncharacterised protein [Vibrio cholerae]|nr:Uncharacterised protein [Vibrio cholerae]
MIEQSLCDKHPKALTPLAHFRAFRSALPSLGCSQKTHLWRCGNRSNREMRR